MIHRYLGVAAYVEYMPRIPAGSPSVTLTELALGDDNHLDDELINQIRWGLPYDTAALLEYSATFRCARVKIEARLKWSAGSARDEAPAQLAQVSNVLDQACAAFAEPSTMPNPTPAQ